MTTTKTKKTESPARMTARLPGAWVPSDLLSKALAAAGPRGFSAWIRDAMEGKLARDGRKPA